MTTPAGRDRRPRATPWPRGLSVRARVLAWVLAVAAAGMALAGATSYLVQRSRVDARIDAALAQEVAEFRSLAETGVDPRTGLPFASIGDLFYVTLLRNVPDSDEGMLTLVDGEVAYYSPGGRPVRLETLPPVVDAGRAASGADTVTLATVATSIGDVRYAAVPVTLEGDPQAGVYVVGIGRDLVQAEVTDNARTFALVAALSLALVALVSWLVAGRLLAPIRLLRQAAQRITETDLGERIEVTGTDDLSDLARTFNGMLDRLEGAFSGQRQLLDDVGHELRTPITIVRGHLELMDSADPSDVAEVRALVLDELDRMNRLVDDLLLLAKARQPDFLRLSSVPVAPLVDEVLDKARALAPRRWLIGSRAEATVSGDPQRLTQALLQLAANAAGFTGPGDEIGIGSAADDGTVWLWVRDTGPGVAPEDAERIFARFARAGPARTSDGAGLGLPIVAAIAEAHGGRVTLTSEPGRGATFTVVLPRSRAPGDGAEPENSSSEGPQDNVRVGTRHDRDSDTLEIPVTPPQGRLVPDTREDRP